MDLELYKENKKLRKKINELEQKIIELESSPLDMLLDALNLYLKDTKQMDQFFRFIKTTTYARCVNTENELIKRWREE